MARLKRTKNGVDAIEHALSGVHTSDNQARIITFNRHPGVVGTTAVVRVDVVDDQPMEREVIVSLAHERRRNVR